MIRRFAALVAASLILVAALPSGVAGADPKGATQSKEFRQQLAKATVNGDKTLTVLIAARKGSNRAVANGIASLGGTVRYREDQMDYIRATIPGDKVDAAAALSG